MRTFCAGGQSITMAEGGALQSYVAESVKQLGVGETDSVIHYLQGLRFMTETECMCVLQGKSLTKEPSDSVALKAKSVKDIIDTIKGRAHIISSEFSKLFRKVEKERWRHVHSSAIKTTCQIRSLLHECNSSIPNPPPGFAERQQLVMEESAKLAQYVESHTENNGHRAEKLAVMQLLTFLGQSFSALVDFALGIHIQNVLQMLQEPQSAFSLKSVLSLIMALGLDGEHMCYLIAREGGVKSLFEVATNSSISNVHSQALRAIATVCCVSESIEELEKVGGVLSLTDMLSDSSVSEMVRAEAAGVVAQITSPCLDQYQHLAGFLENMDDLVQALTALCEGASSHEVFLLGCAALANITFTDSLACDFLMQHSTHRVLIQACHSHKAHSLFSKDQVVTVLANMSSVESCLSDIAFHDGVERLVEFLHECPPDAATEAELMACEHVQQKAAIALTRLCRDSANAQRVVKAQGIPILVKLCKTPKQRNGSDSVLVACLAALRKVCGLTRPAELKTNEDLEQLVKPRLMDSFLLCSGHDENFV